MGLNLLILITGLSAVSYLLILLYFKSKIKTFKQLPVKPEQSSVSLVIPVRNEEQRILKLLDSLNNQHIANESFELILVNDHSTDSTVHLIKKLRSNYQYTINLLSLEEGYGKRAALKLGMDAAKFELIVSSDADCVYHPKWLTSLATLHKSSQAKMIVAPIAGLGLITPFQHLQHLEMLGLMGVSLIGLKLGFPMVCSGANSAFDAEAYKALNPLKITDPKLGDDLALLNTFYKAHRKEIVPVFSPETVVLTETTGSLSAFLVQRSRWAKQTQHVKHGVTWLFGILLGFSTLLPFVLLLGALLFPPLGVIGLLCLALKLIADYSFVATVSKKLHLTDKLRYFKYAAAYNALNAFIMLFSWAISSSWKGRKT